MAVIRCLMFRYFLMVLVQIVCQTMLVALIFLIKMILYGYRPFDEISLNDLLFFPSATTNATFNDEAIKRNWAKDLFLSGQQLPFQLNRLFQNSWCVFFAVLNIYCALLLSRLLQYSVPALRMRTIRSFLPSKTTEAKAAQTHRLLSCLNSKVHIFHFLYELVVSIDQFHFIIILDQLDLSTNEPKTEEESTDVKPAKLEDGQTHKDDLVENDDLADYQKEDSSVIINLPAGGQQRESSHEAINMPSSTVNVDVHQPLSSGHPSDDHQPPNYRSIHPNSNNDQNDG